MTSVSATSQIGQIKAALRHASEATGTDFDYLLRTAQRESSLRPDIKAQTSSATGLFQFIDQTWLGTLKKSGPQFGYSKFANAIERLADGRHKVTDPAMRQEILALRKDPKAASLMAGAYTRDAAVKLTTALGRPPLTGELYIAHFLGPGGAIKLIKAAESTPDKPAADLFPRAARANRPAFYTKSGAERTAMQLYEKLISIYGPGKATFAEVKATTEAKPVATATPTLKPAAAETPRIVPVASNFQLASHFQNIEVYPQGAVPGRPFQSLFVTDGPKPVASTEVARPPGPLVIIPESVRADIKLRIEPAGIKHGAVALNEDGQGPLNIIPQRPVGLLQKHALIHNLFRTDN